MREALDQIRDGHIKTLHKLLPTLNDASALNHNSDESLNLTMAIISCPTSFGNC